MEFAVPDYGMYTGDDDHRIDLRNPHFRQEPYRPQFPIQQAIHIHPQLHAQTDFYNLAHHAPHFAHHIASLAVDVKPRLTKEQHDVLETHYQQQNKPNTVVKKGFAEGLGVSLDKVNVCI